MCCCIWDTKTQGETNFDLIVGVGSTWRNLGDDIKIHSPVFFSLTYVLNKTKQPKNVKFWPLKKIAPPKTKSSTTGSGITGKITIFRKYTDVKAYYWSPVILNGYKWLHIITTNMGVCFKTIYRVFWALPGENRVKFEPKSPKIWQNIKKIIWGNKNEQYLSWFTLGCEI